MTPPRTTAPRLAGALTAALAVALLAGCAGAPWSSQGTASTDPASTDPASPTSPTGPAGPATSDPAAAASSTATAARRIPAGFRLAQGMVGEADEDSLETVHDGSLAVDWELCGRQPRREVDVVDQMAVDNSGGEAFARRELLLLETADQARELVTAVARGAVACDEPGVGGVPYASGEVHDSPLALPGARTVVFRYGEDPAERPGLLVQHLVPVGDAVLVATTYGEWGGDALAGAIDATGRDLAAPVAAMALLPGGGGPSAGEEASDGPEGTRWGLGPIPADVDLTVGLPEDEGDVEVTAASPDGDGIGEIEVCRTVVWPDVPGFEGRLVVAARGPEYADARELWVLPDAGTASAVVERVRDAVASCPRDASRVWTPLATDPGYQSTTFALTWADGLGASLFQLTRVGRALLLTHYYSEGSLASVGEGATDRSMLTALIAEDLCHFTRAGC